MTFLIDENSAGKRLDQILAEQYPDLSRAKLQKYIREGHCKIGNEIIFAPDIKLRLHQKVDFEPPAGQCAIMPEEGEVPVLYQDGDIAIINKPANLTTHPCPSCQNGTLAHRLLARFPMLKKLEGDRPGIVHRLDKDTSGLMIVALNEKTRQKLSEAFAAGKIHKEYVAITSGCPPEIGDCSRPVGRHPSIKTRMAIIPENHGGKAAHTRWKKLWQAANNSCALLQVRIHSGRTHQIRVHMAACGFPVLGDQVYAPAGPRDMADRQMLHAWRLGFEHPSTGEHLTFLASPPEDFNACLNKYSRQIRKIVITGNQGCGKSAFCRSLSNLGLPLVSADEIVARLYSAKSAVSDWLSFHGHDIVLEASGAVKKPELMKLLESSQALRNDFEKFIHALVLDEIEEFWKKERENGSICAAAEVPLYFEAAGPERFGHDVTVVGINCPKSVRWERIINNRGWSMEKTASLESWQIPEERKMALCNIVIDNTGSPDELTQKAVNLYEHLCTSPVRDERLQIVQAYLDGKVPLPELP